MKRFLASLLALVAFGSMVALGAPEPPATRLDSEVVIEPDSSGVDVYSCRAVLRDIENDEVLAAPTIRFRAGDPASIVSELPSGATFELEVDVAATGDSAGWSSELRRGEKVVARQSGVVRLGD